MSFFEFLPSLISYIVCGLTIIHALVDRRENRVQRLLMILALFFYGTLLELIGIVAGNHYYATEAVMLFGVVPLSITLTWIGIIYSVMIIGERLRLSLWLCILTSTSLALSLDWGMDPIAVELGFWTWVFEGGEYFGIPGFNFYGWFFIPFCFMVIYGLKWDKENKKLQLLTISEIDGVDSLTRKLYTCFLVVPMGVGLLFIVGLINLIPIVYNMPLIVLIIWEILTIIGTSGILIWKRENLKNNRWLDMIPPSILLYIGCNFAVFGFIIGRFDLGLHMLLTEIPLLLTYIFTLRKKRE